MTAAEVMAFLKEHENPNGKEVLARHGAREPFFGARIGDMKPLVKKIKQDHELALELYATGNSDAMYFAGLIADADRMSKDDLRRWVGAAYWYMLSESTVAGVAADSPHGWELGLEWIESDQEMIADAGWATLGGWLSVTPDEQVPVDEVRRLLKRVASSIHDQPNRVRYAMNSFVIAVGAYVPELTQEAKAVAEQVGKVQVEMGGTACKVPFAPEYIQKIEARGAIGKKKKTARC